MVGHLGNNPYPPKNINFHCPTNQLREPSGQGRRFYCPPAPTPPGIPVRNAGFQCILDPGDRPTDRHQSGRHRHDATIKRLSRRQSLIEFLLCPLSLSVGNLIFVIVKNVEFNWTFVTKKVRFLDKIDGGCVIIFFLP